MPEALTGAGMGQQLSDICAPRETKEAEDIPSHPGASRVPYARMQLYYASVCKMVRNGEEMGTGWLTTLQEIHPSAFLMHSQARGVAAEDMQVVICPRTCSPTKALASSCTAVFDYVDEGVQGTVVQLQPELFYFSKLDGDYSVVAVEKQAPAQRLPLKLGSALTSKDLPPGATVTVVAHPRGGPREVSIGHVTHFEEKTAVYYNAGSKAAVGSAVFFAHENHLHIVAMGLKSVGEKGKEENMGLAVAAIASDLLKSPEAPPAAAAAPTLLATPTPTPNPMETTMGTISPMSSGMEMSKNTDVERKYIKLPNGHNCWYTGKLKMPQNVPHGEGKAEYEHGVTYEGTWKNGNRDGKGTITRESDGYKSQGECKDDLFVGTWTKYSLKDGSVMDETHYDHSPFDSWKRTLGQAFGSKTADPAQK